MINSKTDHMCLQIVILRSHDRKQLLARDSILQKERRRFLVTCAKLCGASLLLQSIENEIFQAQTCQNNLKYDRACVVTNQDLSNMVYSVCNILKSVNALLSCSAGEICTILCSYVRAREYLHL